MTSVVSDAHLDKPEPLGFSPASVDVLDSSRCEGLDVEELEGEVSLKGPSSRALEVLGRAIRLKKQRDATIPLLQHSNTRTRVVPRQIDESLMTTDCTCALYDLHRTLPSVYDKGVGVTHRAHEHMAMWAWTLCPVANARRNVSVPLRPLESQTVRCHSELEREASVANSQYEPSHLLSGPHSSSATYLFRHTHQYLLFLFVKVTVCQDEAQIWRPGGGTKDANGARLCIMVGDACASLLMSTTGI